MNIKDMTVTELKALAYDHLANIENSQASIRAINAEIAIRQQAKSEEPKEPCKTTE